MTKSKMTAWYNFKTDVHDWLKGAPPDSTLENYLPQDARSLYWEYIKIIGLPPKEAYMKIANVIIGEKG